MKLFNLPDLGEGLADAEIREWHVKLGDEVKVDQPLVCMETAKAVVEVPSPQAGRIKKLFGAIGAVIKTGAALVEFENDGAGEIDAPHDKGSVVGSLEESSQCLDESNVIIGSAQQAAASIKAMPAVRALAKQLNVDLNSLVASGPQGQITAEDVKKAALKQNSTVEAFEPLRGVRRAMAMAMTQSHQEVVPVTIFEDADITASSNNTDVTACLIHAIIAGVQAEPALNAWYDSKNLGRCLSKEINLGLAIDTVEGLFVPVLKNVATLSPAELRTTIETYKKNVKSRTIAAADLQGASISLSNFGMIAGRYATPIIVPPMVAILACGKIRDIPAVYNGEIQIRRIVPLSLTFDHRAVTGGEATRFLAALIKTLEAAP